MSFSTMRPAPLALAVALAFASGPLLAQGSGAGLPGAAATFNISAQPLSQALNDWALQTGAQLIVQPALVSGKRAPAVSGSLTPNQALDRLLSGSGLMATREGNAIVIKAAPPTGDAATLPSVTVTALAERSATTEGTDSLAARAVSINKGDQAIKDIPQSISVLTRKQMDERGIVDLKDAINDTTGTVGISGVGQGMVLSARGFQIDAWQYDGVAIPRNHYTLGNWGTEDMVFYDRLEVLRGASALLQGTGSPGGAVNLVRKRGQSEKTVALTARAGSWDRYGMQLDAGGPLNKEGTLRGRVVLDEARSNSFVDYANDRTRSLYGALDYDISPDTTLGVGISHLDSKGRPFILGVPLYAGGSDVGLPRSTFTGSWWNRSNVEQTTIYADINHRFNEDWKLKVSAMRMTEKNSSKHQRMSGEVAPDGSGPSYDDWITDFDSSKVGLDAYVNGRFEAFGLRNEITVGANYSKYRSRDMYARTFTDGANIFDIDHHRPEPTVESLLAAGGRQSRSGYDVQQKGVYGSWRARLTDPLTAILGARASWYNNTFSDYRLGSQTTESTSGEITPYAGLVYALTPQWSVYGSYTSVFEPQSSRTVAGDVLPPAIGKNYEIGIKGELLDGRLNTSLAIFRYDHKNRAVNDLASGFACDGWYCSTPSGKVRSQGVDAEVSGEVLRNLQVMVGYTYNTTRFLSDPTNQGKVFSTWTPKHLLRAWVSYRFPGEWSRLTVGAGVNAQSHTLDYNRSFNVAGFATASLRVGYQFTPELNLALNVNNVFDRRYLQPGFIGYTGGTYGDPRNFMLTLKYTPKL
ncbi:TonB-dependent siderophore receptor [Ottowia thiooxydans]|uniref:Outer membrane receptor for ferric coprogen and ferric-rhodotorulic acid n=1 Tax=Ottowia thiooxydans TaxID=219182 RepID=A0ABV2Q396_9BURK